MLNRLDIIIYTFAQYAYNKPLRMRYRLKNSHLQILCSLYYIQNLSPPIKAIRTRLQQINPQFDQKRIDLLLQALKERDLIVWEKTDNPKRYTLELSKEGRKIISELYSERAIDDLIDKY